MLKKLVNLCLKTNDSILSNCWIKVEYLILLLSSVNFNSYFKNEKACCQISALGSNWPLKNNIRVKTHHDLNKQFKTDPDFLLKITPGMSHGATTTTLKKATIKPIEDIIVAHPKQSVKWNQTSMLICSFFMQEVVYSVFFPPSQTINQAFNIYQILEEWVTKIASLLHIRDWFFTMSLQLHTQPFLFLATKKISMVLVIDVTDSSDLPPCNFFLYLQMNRGITGLRFDNNMSKYV